MKRPTARSKGILVFTHKEVGQLTRLRAHSSALALAREQFVIGVHYGWFQEAIHSPDWVDFHFAPSSTATFNSSHVCTLPYNSSYFTPACFRLRSIDKQWDIVSVTRPASFKRTDELLRALRLTKTQRPKTRALVICAASARSGARNQGRALWQQYVRDFTETERLDIVFLPVVLDGPPFPFPAEDIAFFYNASRLFTLFSAVEGGSKVIKEAMLCGLPVVLRRGLKGGGLDFANEANSRLFSNEQEAAQAFCEVLDGPAQFKVDAADLAKQVSETHTIPRLLADLQQMFQRLGLVWEGDVDTVDLARKLPSHVPGSRTTRGFWTGDIRSPAAMLSYLETILSEAGVAPPISVGERAAVYLDGVLHESHRRYTAAKDGIRALLPHFVRR